MDEGKATDHTISVAHAKDLAGIVSLPAELRAECLEHFRRTHDTEALTQLFADFIGLANAVVEADREMIELYLIPECDHHPDTARKINLPDLFGALSGIMLAEGIDQSKLCPTCAFRPGTLANQCAVTTCDADWCSHPGEQPFMCHEDMDEKGEPTKACAGFAQLRRARMDRDD